MVRILGLILLLPAMLLVSLAAIYTLIVGFMVVEITNLFMKLVGETNEKTKA